MKKTVEYRKDAIGQDIKVRDIIAYGDSRNTAGVRIGMVLGYSSKLIQTTLGAKDKSSMVVVTEGYKLHNEKQYEQFLTDYKDDFVEIEDTVERAAKKYYTVTVRAVTQNAYNPNKPKTYDDFEVTVEVYHDGVLQGTRNASRTDTSNDLYEVSWTLIKDVTPSWKRVAGADYSIMTLDDGGYGSYQAKHYRLAASAIKKLLGFVPDSTKVIPLLGVGSVVDMFTKEGFAINPVTKYSGGKLNIFGEYMKGL